MKAVVLVKPGELRVADVDSPPPPAPDEALVRVRRVGVCGTDLHAFHGRQPFFSYPRILGHELAVEVLEVRAEDSGLKPGDRCAVEPYLSCGLCGACRRGKTNCCSGLKVLGVHTDGGMREMLTLPRSKLHQSGSLSFDQLAIVEMLSVGLHAVGRAALTPEDTVLVVGAGPIGLAVIEFVRLAGLRASVMDIDERRLAWCRDALKIPHCLNAAKDPVPELLEWGSGDLPTVVFDCTGNRDAMMKSFHYVAHGGKVILVGLFQGDLTFNDPYFHSHEVTLYASRNATSADLRRTIRLMESGLIDAGRWITHRVAYPETPERLPRWANGDEAYRKGLVEW